MALDLPSPEVRKFMQALEGFMENPPRDLPDGVVDTAKGLLHNLKGYDNNTPEEVSPGEKEAAKASGGSDEPVSYRDAARGEDEPSPGQKEFQRVQEAAQQFAASLSDSGSGS